VGIQRRPGNPSDNLTDADPHFVDPSSGNYQLRDDSPAFAIGFNRTPIEGIGPEK
jgi:hypothetical protein